MSCFPNGLTQLLVETIATALRTDETRHLHARCCPNGLTQQLLGANMHTVAAVQTD